MTTGPCLCGDPECFRCFGTRPNGRRGRCTACKKFLPGLWIEDTCENCKVACTDCGEPTSPSNPGDARIRWKGRCVECDLIHQYQRPFVD